MDAYSGSQPQTRAASSAQVQAVPDDATLQAAFSARKSCMKTQGMNILAVHPLNTDGLDHLLNATCFISTSNAAAKSSISKIFAAAPLKSTPAAQDVIFHRFVGKFVCGPVLHRLTGTL